MRKIIVSEFYTLDGLMSDPEDKMDWVTSIFTPDVGKYEDDLYDSADTLLLGRVTYKIFESYWPIAPDNPKTSKGDIEMAHKINNITKIVFSKTLKKVKETPVWKNVRLFKKIIPEEIKKTKTKTG